MMCADGKRKGSVVILAVPSGLRESRAHGDCDSASDGCICQQVSSDSVEGCEPEIVA